MATIRGIGTQAMVAEDAAKMALVRRRARQPDRRLGQRPSSSLTILVGARSARPTLATLIFWFRRRHVSMAQTAPAAPASPVRVLLPLVIPLLVVGIASSVILLSVSAVAKGLQDVWWTIIRKRWASRGLRRCGSCWC